MFQGDFHELALHLEFLREYIAFLRAIFMYASGSAPRAISSFSAEAKRKEGKKSDTTIGRFT